MCEEFARQGVDVELVVPNKKNLIGINPFLYWNIVPLFSIRRVFISDMGSRTERFPVFMFLFDQLFFLLSIMFTVGMKGVDVLYTRDYFLLFACPKKVPKRVIEVHDIPHFLFLFRIALRRATHVIALTNGVRDALIALGIPAPQIVVAHDAVHLAEFAHPESKLEARERLGIAADEQVAMYIGRIDRWKGTDILFAAAKILKKTRIVVIGGEESELNSLRTQYPNVLFVGARPYKELANNMSAADVLVLPNSGKFEISSLYTSPLKLFAYMTSLRPIISSDLPSIREVLDDSSAYFVQSDDPIALANGIEYAIENTKSKTVALSAQRIVQQYTWEKRVKLILKTLL